MTASMIWTKEPPSEPGWYWRCSCTTKVLSCVELYTVVKQGKTLWCQSNKLSQIVEHYYWHPATPPALPEVNDVD